MAALFNANRSARQSRRASQRNRKKRPAQSADWFVNFLMLGLSVLVLSFVWSFWNRHTNNRIVSTELNLLAEQPSMATPETLIAAKKYPHVTVEILNGCGISGLAARFKEIVHSKTFDVQHTENAAHFKFQQTEIIARSDNTEAAFTLAKELGLDPSRVTIQKDPTVLVDVTMIIGHDYTEIPAYAETN